MNKRKNTSQRLVRLGRKKVVVAMSGGVDSSVAAALLKKQGFDVIGLFLKFWSAPRSFSEVGAENKCCSAEAAEAARKVAQKLDIPFYVLDFRKSFKKQVVDYFISEYKSGRTPNPCVKCNQFIKFGKLLEKAKDLGADFLATGHYVCIAHKIKNQRAKSKNTDQNSKFKLLEAKDEIKDQSYFLWTLKQEQLKRLLFPVGDYTKDEVRKMAKKWGLPTALRRESQEICFVFGAVQEFLKKYIKPKKGKILDLKGKVVGEHEGAVFYTVGQRHSLPLKPKTPLQKPYYVIKTDVKKNIVVVGQEENLYSKELIAEEVNWIDESRVKSKSFECRARIRYGHPAIPCRVSKLKSKNEKLKIIFEKPVRAITPGQSVVFYQGQEVLGGGVIAE